MRKIGFVDYYLNEWHADHYPQWIKELNEKNGTDFEFAYAWAEIDSPKGGMTTDEWCKTFGAERCATIQELCEKSDAIVILAPDNCEKHLEYVREVFPYGKPTCIDKTFAANYEEAKAIFELGKQYNTPFFSTSSLRYATELADFRGKKDIIVTGTGVSASEYLVHICEMLISVLKEEIVAAKIERQGTQLICRAKLDNGGYATLIQAYGMPYTVTATNEAGDPLFASVQSDFFGGLMKDMLRFFDEKTPSFDTAQTLKLMRLREGLLVGLDHEGEWIDLDTICN